MKRLTTLMVLIALAFGLGATTVTVGTNHYHTKQFPIDPSYDYNYTQQICSQYKINRAGEISKIRFYFRGSQNADLSQSHNWTIYMGHISRPYFTSKSDWEPIANLTQVFSGIVANNFPAASEWMEIVLQTPFNYNNTDNLLVAVHEYTPGSTNITYWGGHSNNDDYGLSYYGQGSGIDVNNPPPALVLTDRIATIQLVFPDTEAPLAPTPASPENNATLMNGYFLQWGLPSGSADASGYDVYIDGAIVSENQPGTRYKLSGLSAGPHTWHIVARNQFGISPPSVTCNIIIVPSADIGNGDEDNGLPIKPSARYSYSQSIYLKSEIDDVNHQTEEMGYYIRKIAYYWSGGFQGANSQEWVVYMGNTSRTAFNSQSAWIPTSQMEQVFAGRLFLPMRPGWIEIELDTPFLYNNCDNLVIAVDENEPGEDTENCFFHSTTTPGQNRSIQYYTANDNNIDPDLPPIGVLKAAYPNILIQLSDLITTPILSVTPATLDYGLVLNGVTTESLNVTVTNTGVGTLELAAADISIIGPNAAEYSADLANLPASLMPMESVTIPVSLTGVTSGISSNTLRVVYGGENHDVELVAHVLSPGSAIIGNGTHSLYQPFEVEYAYGRSAALYTADQINAVGSIDMLAWNCNRDYHPEVTYKIWLKNTNDTIMETTTWQDMTADMTMVKEGSFVAEAEGWKVFQLETPFEYTGANLIVGVETSGRGYYLFGGAYWGTDVRRPRHQSWASNSNPPSWNGTVRSYIPDIAIQLSSNVVNDIGATNISGNQTPIVGVESQYSVRLRNNGSNAQDNYQVKLMGTNEIELAVVNGPAIEGGEVINVPIPWTPTTAGETSIYAKIEMAGDELTQNNQCAPLSLNIQPEYLNAADIGAGDMETAHPMNFYADDYLYEALYTADELGINSGTIYSMVIHSRCQYDMPHKPATIYLASTDQAGLSAGFTPISQMTKVFDGYIDYVNGANAVLINFRVPYTYTGGNLKVLYYRPYCGFSEAHCNFLCQVAPGRGRFAVRENYYTPIDPHNPPAGTLVDIYPKATFFYTTELIENDMCAWTLSGDNQPVAGVSSNYTVHIRNNGSADQSSYQVKLMGQDDTVLAAVEGPPISSSQSLDVEVPWTPNTVGAMTIRAEVELNSDEYAGNDSTEGFEVKVYPLGVVDVVAMLNDTEDAVELSWADQTPTSGLGDKTSPMLTGYIVYRRDPLCMLGSPRWVALTPEPITGHGYTDQAWAALPSGDHCWAVKAVYTEDEISLPGFSNTITCNTPSGFVLGRLCKVGTDDRIMGATVTNGVLTHISNHFGDYGLWLPAGTHTITASAPGFITQTVENVVVTEGNRTTLNFWLEAGTSPDDPQIPVVATALNGNYPNPFNPETTISYSVMKPGRVSIEIYNIKGQLVRNLVDEEQATGHYKRVFNGKDNGGRSLASGVYLIRMSAPGYQKVAKMMLMK